jgi:hypothetical protein
VSHPRQWILAATAALLTSASGTLVACGGGGNGGRTEYAKDGDTGAAAPATQQTLSPNPAMGDSTSGMSTRTGRPGAAGDTVGAFGKAAGQQGAVPGRPTAGPPGSGMEAEKKRP